MRRPRVAMLRGGRRSYGGQPMAAVRTVKLLEDQVEVVPVWLEAAADNAKVEKLEGGVVLTPFKGAAGLPWLSAQLERLEVEAFHLHGVFEYPLACVGIDTPIIASFRGSDINLGVYRHAAVLETLLGRAEVCTFMNRAQELLARRLFSVRGECLTVPNHVVPREVVPAVLPWPRPLIGCVAEFRRVTGLDILLKAFAVLGRGSLLLVGPFHPVDAGYYSKILDAMPSVYRTGAVSSRRVRELMAACDVMAFPSVCEGMPNKVLEAMVTGVPVVASDVAGNRPLIEDGQHGRLFATRDTKDLIRVLKEVLEATDSHRCQWVDHARQRVAQEFSAEGEREGWLRAYRLAGVKI